MKMITQNLLLIACSSLLIVSFNFFQTSHAKSPCTPSACGTIRNISNPFRLGSDPSRCGDRKFELSCENNVTTVYLSSIKYHVKEINYDAFTIRLADASITNNICSILTPSAKFSYSYAFFTSFKPYALNYYYQDDGFRPVTLMSCPYLLRNSSNLTRVTGCDDLSTNSSRGRYSYLKADRMYAREVVNMCTVESVVLTVWNFRDLKNVSLSEIHQSLLFGFQLSWFCSFKCHNGLTGCYPRDSSDSQYVCGNSFLYDKWVQIKDSFRPPEGPTTLYLMIPLFVFAFLFAGISIPAKIIIAYGVFSWMLLEKYWKRAKMEKNLVITFGVRFAVGFIPAMVFLIYKFRRRHKSMYNVIEDYLESDNRLAPIRYSYSDLKKMTRGFREKLGQGGFGSVYKGKLRSGNDVAVKVLEKATENGQDFINEIATIGRIHHVNVVKLVGYCAERSKRALIFDFMPNGSLEKYIFGRDETHSMDWEMKFKIAVGVARGIEYLHCGCDIQILHFDIKPHNILLDDNFVPKVSDFGLAKLCAIEKDAVTLTAARGTIGYVAPELINRSIGRVSYKADVYSFGMLLIEMVGLNRNLRGNDESSKYFPYWIYDDFNQGREIEIDIAGRNNADSENDSTRKLIRKITIVALWCIQMSPDERPSMGKVLEMLEGDVESLKIPKYPSQFIPIGINLDLTGTTYTTDDSTSLLSGSEAPSTSTANISAV